VGQVILSPANLVTIRNAEHSSRKEAEMKPSSHGATALETTARVEKTMAASAADIWNALTNPALIKKYFFGADAQSDFRLGSPIRWTGDFKGKRFEDKGEILISDPGR
jgi:uncharacterized protein YndB with AHSA1/START domain